MVLGIPLEAATLWEDLAAGRGLAECPQGFHERYQAWANEY